MLEYRPFRNTDSPGLIEVWNESFGGRSAVRLGHGSALERFVLSRPYFDAAGLIVAVDSDVRVGFVHAGFGPNESESGLSVANGVTCALAVRPTARRRGIGTELLKRAESYLRSKGSQTLFAGSTWPLSPFYLGVYGGCCAPGILASEERADRFLTQRGYVAGDGCLVFQRRLGHPLTVVDPRFARLRRQFDLKVLPEGSPRSWWWECACGPLEPLEIQLVDREEVRVARAEVWEMEGFSNRWGAPAVGILQVEVEAGHRRQGLAKFLLMQVMRQLQEQYFELVEVQAPENNTAAVRLLHSLGFEQIDIGRRYQKPI